MATSQIMYRSGYKYQIGEDYTIEVSVKPEVDIHTNFIDLSSSGELVIKNGYAWDGPSGPSIDTKNFMRGSLIHDALYQLMRQDPPVLSAEHWRKEADLELKRICIEDGMARFRAWYVYISLRIWGKPATSPDNRKKMQTAP